MARNEGAIAKEPTCSSRINIKLNQQKDCLKQYIRCLKQMKVSIVLAEYNGIRVQIVKNCLDIAVIATSFYWCMWH